MLAHSESQQPATLPQAQSVSAEPSPRKRSTARKRIAFFEALDAGCTNREASRRAGCNESTGSKWAKERVVRGSELPSKDALVGDLFKAYMGADTPYKANLAKRIFEALGFAMPKRAEDSDRAPSADLRTLFAVWTREQRRCDNRMSDNERYVTSSGGDAVSASNAGGPTEPGSPQASASGGVLTHSQTAPDSEKVSDPPPQNLGKVE